MDGFADAFLAVGTFCGFCSFYLVEDYVEGDLSCSQLGEEAGLVALLLIDGVKEVVRG